MTDHETENRVSCFIKSAINSRSSWSSMIWNLCGKFAKTVTVMHEGTILREGTMKGNSGNDDKVTEVYLGQTGGLISMFRIEHLQVGQRESMILRDVTMQIEPGQVVCLMGQNGVGKTTPQ